MPNPKGNPDSLKPYQLTTFRDEPLRSKLTVRVADSMMEKLKALDNYPEFVRQAIAKALSELENTDDEIT